MNKSESKYFNTAMLMDKALLEILGKKSLEYVTVKEICEKAGVNRSTFYLHYETINDLLEEAISYIHEKFIASYDITPEKFIEKIATAQLDELILINDEYLRPYLEFIAENRNVFMAVAKNPSESQLKYIRMEKYILKPILERFHVPKEEQNFHVAFYINGTWAIVQEWIKHECKESIDSVIRIIESCVRPIENVK